MGGHQILYNYRKGAIRVAGEKSGQKMNLMHWIFKISIGSDPGFQQLLTVGGFLLFLKSFYDKSLELGLECR